MSEGELDRIRAAYGERDAAADTPYRWSNPGYVTYMQLVERALLRALDDAGTPLAEARVLDVGCGAGYFLQRPSEYGAGECHGGGTQTVGLDEDALRSLFGVPRPLRRVALRFDLAQIAGRHALLAQTLALARPLRSHVLGLWDGRAP